MPHILIEYTPNLGNLPFDAMLQAVTRNLAQSPEVGNEADLKARVLRPQAFRVGLDNGRRGFVHATVRILSGRTPEAKRDFAQRVASGLLDHMPAFGSEMDVHLSVEVVDMDRESYFKVRLN